MSQFPPTEGPDGANNNSGADQAGAQGYPDTSGATNHGPQSAPLNGPDGNQQYGDETLPMDPSAVRQAAQYNGYNSGNLNGQGYNTGNLNGQGYNTGNLGYGQGPYQQGYPSGPIPPYNGAVPGGPYGRNYGDLYEEEDRPRPVWPWMVGFLCGAGVIALVVVLVVTITTRKNEPNNIAGGATSSSASPSSSSASPSSSSPSPSTSSSSPHSYASTPSASRSASATPSIDRATTKVKVDVEVKANGKARVSYGPYSSTSTENISSDWRKEGIETTLKDSYTLNASGSYGDGGATKVSCKITVNGETVSENQASGTYSTVSCHIPYSYVPKQ
ncbi:MAG: hypothetical protein Q3991_09655 [Rothia sp. (in: high G+C Gram-positive bacteria)]|uniref:hypothetical protein n=1 Tax=Rothia sp. (in: high G+C Gram-positive bacteria) TaxID=1885016 RepID=UPI0026DBC1F5|nr:hypothetical protein [Rothia sp. (in: high G+C Gram-positive bacteria)]MDO4885195.1 hypothetical protein [Rothia sp. (in: high G+C Gram-positive bacteria)]